MINIDETQTAQIRDLLKPFHDNVLPPDFKRDNLISLVGNWSNEWCVGLPGVEIPCVTVPMTTLPAFPDATKMYAVHPLGLNAFYTTNYWALLPVQRTIVTLDVQCAPGTPFESILPFVEEARVEAELRCKKLRDRLLEHDLAVIMPPELHFWPAGKEQAPHQLGIVFTCAAARVTLRELMKVPFFKIPLARPKWGSPGSLPEDEFLDFKFYA